MDTLHHLEARALDRELASPAEEPQKMEYVPPAMMRITGGDEADMGVGIAAVAVWAIGIGLGWAWT